MRGGSLLYCFLYARRSLRSASDASSGFVRRFRKWVQALNLVFSLWFSSLLRIDVSLFPMYSTTLPLAFPISYTPASLMDKACMTAFVNGVHIALIGITNLLRMTYLQPCYNTIVGLGGFEPPRQMSASSFQSYRACQLHHSPNFENLDGESQPATTPSESPCFKDIPKHGHLSIGKPIVNIARVDNKPIITEGTMAVCPKCYSRDMIRWGKYGRLQKWHCQTCGYTTVNPRQRKPKGSK